MNFYHYIVFSVHTDYQLLFKMSPPPTAEAVDCDQLPLNKWHPSAFRIHIDDVDGNIINIDLPLSLQV